MKEITHTASLHLMDSCPGARLEQRGFDKVLIVPAFDIDSGETKVTEYKVVDDPKS